MRIGRTILAFSIALSLAMLPIAGAFAVQKDEITASELVVASAHDCCDHDGMPAGHPMKECQAAAGCFAKCFNFCAVVFPSATIHPPIGGIESKFATKIFRSQTGNPPFRPPRV